MRCDFCGVPKPTWAYPCETFENFRVSYVSVSEWLACEHCHELIERNDWDGLLTRCVRHYLSVKPNARNIDKAQLRDGFRAAWAQFQEHRTGEPHLLTERLTEPHRGQSGQAKSTDEDPRKPWSGHQC